MSSRGRRRGACPRADDTRVLMPIATHRAARIGRAEAARDAAEGAPRTSARAVDVPCIIGSTSAREPREDGARHDARSTHPASPRCAPDASAETLAVARARLRGGRASGRGRGRRARAGRRANQPRACRASGRYRLRRAECRARTRVTQRLRISPRATRGLRRGAATVDKKRVFVNEHPVDKNDKTRECTGTQQSEPVRANSARGHNAQQTFCEKLSRPYLLILDYEKKRRTPL